jgi:hypothetical protein
LNVERRTLNVEKGLAWEVGEEVVEVVEDGFDFGVFGRDEVVLCKRGGVCDDREMWSVVGEPVTLRF